jgi:hypothetical protein
VRRTKKQFFFEKKNQKIFDLWYGAASNAVPKVKSFLLLFFKKEAFLLLRLPP